MEHYIHIPQEFYNTFCEQANIALGAGAKSDFGLFDDCVCGRLAVLPKQ